MVGSHIIRFLAEDSGQRALRAEVAGLRVEVHRAKQLVSDYNSVLTECEEELGWSRYLGKLVSTFNLVIGTVGVLIWIINWAWGRASFNRQSVDSQLSLADSESILPVRTRGGPLRPSDFGRAQAR